MACLPVVLTARDKNVSINGDLVYGNIPVNPSPNYPNELFEQGHILEIGDRLILSGTSRRLTAVVVMLSSSAQSSDFGGLASFSYPVTLRIYDGRRWMYPGPFLASMTQTVNIPYCPSGWVSNGIAFSLVFDFHDQTIGLPDQIIYTVSVNTAHFGIQPTGGTGQENYNGIGFAFNCDTSGCGGLQIGARDPNFIFNWRDTPAFYGDGGLLDARLRRDRPPLGLACAGAPLVQIYALGPVLPTSVQLYGQTNFPYTGQPLGPLSAQVTGSGGSVSLVYSGTGSTDYPATTNPPIVPGSYVATAIVAPDAVHFGAVSSPLPFVIAPPPVPTVPTVTPKGLSGTADPEVPLLPASALVGLAVALLGVGIWSIDGLDKMGTWFNWRRTR